MNEWIIGNICTAANRDHHDQSNKLAIRKNALHFVLDTYKT